MRLRKRHFLHSQRQKTKVFKGAEVLTPSPLASTMRSFSTQVPSDFLIVPFSQSIPAISVVRLSWTGWPSVALRCSSSPEWRCPWRRKRKAAPYLSCMSSNESCHVVSAVAPSTCRICYAVRAGPQSIGARSSSCEGRRKMGTAPTHLQRFHATNALEIETPTLVHLFSIRRNGKCDARFV